MSRPLRVFLRNNLENIQVFLEIFENYMDFCCQNPIFSVYSSRQGFVVSAHGAHGAHRHTHKHFCTLSQAPDWHQILPALRTQEMLQGRL